MHLWRTSACYIYNTVVQTPGTRDKGCAEKEG